MTPDSESTVVSPPGDANVLVPGRTRAKLVAFFLSLGLGVVALWELSWPVWSVAHGRRVPAQVVAIHRMKPGSPDRVYTSAASVELDEARSAIYVCEVEYLAESGGIRRSLLNTATQIRPARGIGDIVTIVGPADESAVVLDVYDWRTWTMGLFLGCAATAFVLVSGCILRAAHRPINIPEDCVPAGWYVDKS